MKKKKIFFYTIILLIYEILFLVNFMVNYRRVNTLVKTKNYNIMHIMQIALSDYTRSNGFFPNNINELKTNFIGYMGKDDAKYFKIWIAGGKKNIKFGINMECPDILALLPPIYVQTDIDKMIAHSSEILYFLPHLSLDKVNDGDIVLAQPFSLNKKRYVIYIKKELNQQVKFVGDYMLESKFQSKIKNYDSPQKQNNPHE